MKIRLTKKKKVLGALVLAGAVVAGSGAAYAYWTTTGTGSGSAQAATTSTITAVQTSTINTMAPGVAAQTLSGKFNNGNSGPVYVATVTASIGTVTKAVGAPSGTCDATDFTLSNATMNVNAEVPAGNNQGSWTGATIAFNDKATNQDACKLATVTVNYTIG